MSNMKITDIKLNLAGINSIMSSSGVEQIIKSKVEAIAEDAKAEARSENYTTADYDAVVDKHNRGIPAGHVFPNYLGAVAHNKTGCLLTAFDKAMIGNE